MAIEQAKKNNRMVKFLFPSSIAVYGVPDLSTKYQIGKSIEDEWCQPITMYGITKLHCEQLGSYYSDHYRQLDQHAAPILIDFRSLRFPGLISATTMPSGGTSDYLPEVIHYAIQGKAYSCFVREDTRIPFMAMPDAIRALLQLEAAPGENLKRRVYNVTAFNPSAGEFYEALRQEFAHMHLSFEPNKKRQAIVDSWPVDLDDSAARRDWGWKPDFSLQTALETYLIPTIRKKYKSVDHAPVA
jgi:nucleoside-diphosphate-sugar epimerase